MYRLWNFKPYKLYRNEKANKNGRKDKGEEKAYWWEIIVCGLTPVWSNVIVWPWEPINCIKYVFKGIKKAKCEIRTIWNDKLFISCKWGKSDKLYYMILTNFIT